MITAMLAHLELSVSYALHRAADRLPQYREALLSQARSEYGHYLYLAIAAGIKPVPIAYPRRAWSLLPDRTWAGGLSRESKVMDTYLHGKLQDLGVEDQLLAIAVLEEFQTIAYWLLAIGMPVVRPLILDEANHAMTIAALVPGYRWRSLRWWWRLIRALRFLRRDFNQVQ